MLRVGLGTDLHRLVQGRRFILGGVEISSDRGELGHSDGDVLIHAIIDSFLGATASGDIGEFFPPTDPRWKDGNSLDMLGVVYSHLQEQGWHLLNLDCVVCTEKPRILPSRDKIRDSLARALRVKNDDIFIKGKTGEGIGPVGEGLAVEAMAVCLLEK
ncbi:2-C-methyl-D-erythritol 2,4-cyclodiphosphate synthase [Breznakiellaceae bacterium SP9]